MIDMLNSKHFDLQECHGAERSLSTFADWVPFKKKHRLSCFNDRSGFTELIPDRPHSYMKPCCAHIFARLFHATLVVTFHMIRVVLITFQASLYGVNAANNSNDSNNVVGHPAVDKNQPRC